MNEKMLLTEVMLLDYQVSSFMLIYVKCLMERF